MENKRNSFTALCEYASKNNWCWKLFCTTCGHGAFKGNRGQVPFSRGIWLF